MVTLSKHSSPSLNKKPPYLKWSSNRGLWAGIIFSVLFTVLIWLARPFLPEIDFLPDQGGSWYYWKLPEPTFWSRASVWGGYALHQISLWGLIYYGQKNKLKYSNKLHRLNWVALGVNAFFITLHLVQTLVWYDGLAQDVSIWSSQFSVVLLLVMVLLMENQRRGLFFGKKVGFLKETGRVARKYHGYIFAWGIIYTFWYHPMEGTSFHLLGFLYTFLLMLQGCLMFTRSHVNKWWTVTLEVAVLFHGTLVAIFTQTIWPMFFFGFASLWIITQMHGLGLSRRAKWGWVIAYVAAIGIVYSSRGWENVNEVLRIPLTEYLAVFLLALIIWLITFIGRKVTQVLRPAPA